MDSQDLLPLFPFTTHKLFTVSDLFCVNYIHLSFMNCTICFNLHSRALKPGPEKLISRDPRFWFLSSEESVGIHHHHRFRHGSQSGYFFIIAITCTHTSIYLFFLCFSLLIGNAYRSWSSSGSIYWSCIDILQLEKDIYKIVTRYRYNSTRTNQKRLQPAHQVTKSVHDLQSNSCSDHNLIRSTKNLKADDS